MVAKWAERVVESCWSGGDSKRDTIWGSDVFSRFFLVAFSPSVAPHFEVFADEQCRMSIAVPGVWYVPTICAVSVISRSEGDGVVPSRKVSRT
jgi:hypothetical protein